MATFPRTAITGTNIIDDPRSQHISIKLSVLPFTSVPKGGNFKGGKPDLTSPITRAYIDKSKLISLHTEINFIY